MSEPAAVEQQSQRVDETPISPIRPDAARKNSLENHLMHRPNRAELVESEQNLLIIITGQRTSYRHRLPHQAFSHTRKSWKEVCSRTNSMTRFLTARVQKPWLKAVSCMKIHELRTNNMRKQLKTSTRSVRVALNHMASHSVEY